MICFVSVTLFSQLICCSTAYHISVASVDGVGDFYMAEDLKGLVDVSKLSGWHGYRLQSEITSFPLVWELLFQGNISLLAPDD